MGEWEASIDRCGSSFVLENPGMTEGLEAEIRAY